MPGVPSVPPPAGDRATAVDVRPEWILAHLTREDGATRASDSSTVPAEPGLFDAIDEAVALVGGDGRLVWANAALARLVATSASVLRQRPLHDLVPNPGTPLPDAGRGPGWAAALARRGDGETLAVDIRVALAGPGHALVTIRDAAPRQRLERALRANNDLAEQLRRSQKIGALGRLAGGVAHDFNNLLQVIGGYAEALGSERLDGESRQRVLDSIQAATSRASSLTRQLLAFGRRQVLVPQVLDLNATMRSLEHMLQRVIGEHIALVTTPAPGLRAVKVDAGQIEQVVLNLAINARDAMPDGGTLEIATANIDVVSPLTTVGMPVPLPQGRWVALVVRDTGTGMDADTASQAFEPFFTTKDAAHGSGLGLSMVYGIVKQSDGYTWIESAPGAGTAVHVLLPAVDAAVEAPPPAPPQLPAAPGATGTVLLVEDDGEVRTLFATFLRLAGYQVLEAGDGREAIALFEAHGATVDVVVTDVVMPNISGPALVGVLRGQRPDVKVLYLSGYNEQIAPGPGPDPGTVHVPKPITRAALIEQVGALVGSHPPPDPAA